MKKTLFILLVIICVFFCCQHITMADELVCFEIYDGVEVITAADARTLEFRDSVEVLVIPQSVKKIGLNFFSEFPALKYVYMHTKHDIASSFEISVKETTNTKYNFTVYGYDNAREWVQLMNFPYSMNNMGLGNHMPQSNFINFVPMEQAEVGLNSNSQEEPISSNIKVYLNGEQIYFDVQPFVMNERVLLPVRAIYEAMGAVVEWNQESQTVLATKWNEKSQKYNYVTIKIGSEVLITSFNTSYYHMDVPAMIVDGRTLVPLRGVAESFDYNVEWDAATNSVYITDTTDDMNTRGF